MTKLKINWTSEDSEAEERFQKVERVLGLLALLQEVPHRSSASTRLHHFDQQFCDENEAETREEQIKEPPLMDFNFISTLRWVFIHEPIYFIDAAVASGFAYSIYNICHLCAIWTTLKFCWIPTYGGGAVFSSYSFAFAAG